MSFMPRVGNSAARMFRLLSVYPDPAISVTAAASIAAMPEARARQVLQELCHAHMITESVPGRYSFHDLLRVYAAERAACDGTAEQGAAEQELGDKGQQARVHITLAMGLELQGRLDEALGHAQRRPRPLPGRR
jgi:hypothetical protein